MSLPEQSVVLSIKALELPNKSAPSDDTTCYFYLNSSPFSVAKISNPTNSVLVPAESLDDSLQLVFRGIDQKETIGSVSFRMNYFAQVTSNRFTRWITLFNDPICDSFAGNIGGENSDRPRVLIDFEISKEEAFPTRPDLVSFEHYLKEKEQNGLVLPQIKEELEMSDLKDSLDDQNYISIGGASAVEIHEVALPQPVKILSVKDEDNVKSVVSEENAYKSKSQAEGLVEALSSQDLNRTPKQKGDFEVRKESKGEGLLEQQNILLTQRVNELNQRIQELENKNVALKESEDVCLTKLHHLKIDFEKLRFKTENYETMVNETEVELADVKDQLAAELAVKAQLEKDKEGLTVSLQQAKEAYEELRNIASVDQENPTTLKEEAAAGDVAQANEQIIQHYEQLISEKDKTHSEEIEGLRTQNNQLMSDVQIMKAKIQGDEAIIHSLQKELAYLRQKDEEASSLGLSEKLKEAEDKIRFYEEKTKSMIEVCAAFLFKDMNNFESIDDMIIRVKKEIDNSKQEMQELRTINEALELKLSICDNKLLADTLWGQINDFKHQVTSLERERESQKNELFKVNENYTKLINKYTELTEVLATLQQPVQKAQPVKNTTPQKPTPTMSSLNKNVPTKLSTRIAAETPDEVEAKLIEFTSLNKISPSFLTKVEKGVYLYNGRKINLKVISGKLMVKGVTGYKPLQDFIRGESGNGTRTPPRNAKEFPRTERKSADGKIKRDKLELGGAQVADHMRRDLTPDSVRSVSFSSKEGLKDFATPKDYDTRPLLTEPCFSETTKSRGNEQVRVKDLIASRSVERRISYNISRSGQKSQRESLF